MSIEATFPSPTWWGFWIPWISSAAMRQSFGKDDPLCMKGFFVFFFVVRAFRGAFCQATPKTPKHRTFGKQLLGSIACVSTRWWMMIDVLLMNIMDEIVVYHSLESRCNDAWASKWWKIHSKHLFVALTKFTKVAPKWAMMLAILYQWNGV